MKIIKEILKAKFYFLLGFIIAFFIYLNKKFPRPSTRTIIKTKVVRDTLVLKHLKATYYNPSVDQCDSSPFITADGTHLTKSTKNLVSLSRDLLKKFPYGSKIEVVQPKHMRGIYYVHDCMSKRFKNRIDFFTFGKINVRYVLIKYN